MTALASFTILPAQADNKARSCKSHWSLCSQKLRCCLKKHDGGSNRGLLSIAIGIGKPMYVLYLSALSASYLVQREVKREELQLW